MIHIAVRQQLLHVLHAQFWLSSPAFRGDCSEGVNLRESSAIPDAVVVAVPGTANLPSEHTDKLRAPSILLDLSRVWQERTWCLPSGWR